MPIRDRVGLDIVEDDVVGGVGRDVSQARLDFAVVRADCVLCESWVS